MEKFNAKLNIVLNEKNRINLYSTKLKYDELIEHIINIKNSSQKLKPNDYKLLKKYDVIKIPEINKLIVPITAGNNNYYIKFNILSLIIY
jgi:hypothetical protein